MAANDYVAVSAMEALREENYSILDDISIIGYDNLKIASLVISHNLCATKLEFFQVHYTTWKKFFHQHYTTPNSKDYYFRYYSKKDQDSIDFVPYDTMRIILQEIQYSLNVLASKCLNRQIDNIGIIERENLGWYKHRKMSTIKFIFQILFSIFNSSQSKPSNQMFLNNKRKNQNRQYCYYTNCSHSIPFYCPLGS